MRRGGTRPCPSAGLEVGLGPVALAAVVVAVEGALTFSPPVSLGLARVSANAGATNEVASSIPRPKT
jgi:hypothetical protein